MPSGMSAYAAMAVVCTVVAGYWHVFAKAGRKGWEALIPGWNLLILMRIIGRPAWWALGFLPGPISLWLAKWAVAEWQSRMYWAVALPGVALTGLLHHRTSMDLAKSFGRRSQFGWRLFWLPIVYIPWLGFGYSEYGGPATQKEGREERRKRKAEEEAKAKAAYAAKLAARQVAQGGASSAGRGQSGSDGL